MKKISRWDKATWPWWYKIYRKVRAWKWLYWLRTHTINRYHIINISGQGDYSWGWIDRSQAMYLACFALLVDFVENEKPYKTIGGWSWEGTPPKDDPEDPSDPSWVEAVEHQFKIGEEVKELYLWWTKGRAEEHEQNTKLFEKVKRPLFEFEELKDGSGLHQMIGPDRDDPDYKAWFEDSQRLDKKDDEMFERLLKVRKYLWT